MYQKLLLLLVLLSVVHVGLSLFDSSDESVSDSHHNSTENKSNENDDLEGLLVKVLGGRKYGKQGKNKGPAPKCGPKDKCPLHKCRLDPAIIHGYCCGCAKKYDHDKVTCPVNLQCPLYSEPLCSDYHYMAHCCCEK